MSLKTTFSEQLTTETIPTFTIISSRSNSQMSTHRVFNVVRAIQGLTRDVWISIQRPECLLKNDLVKFKFTKSILPKFVDRQALYNFVSAESTRYNALGGHRLGCETAHVVPTERILKLSWHKK